MDILLGKWFVIPYPGDKRPPVGLDPLSGSWPMYFFERNKSGMLTTSSTGPIYWPNTINNHV